MSTLKTTIFYTGATGYIGGTALQRILNHPKANTFDITVLVRNAEKAKLLETNFSLKVALGSLQDTELLTKHAENADIVIHTADADDETAMKAILKGLKNRHDKLGKKSVLIHTSGTGVLTNDARGEFASPTVTSDLDIDALNAIPSTALHRPVDLLAMNADSHDGYVHSYIVFPSLIYGIATGALYESGISHNQTFQLPILIRIFLQRGRAGVVGSGACRWPEVHIDDNADAYYLLFDAILKDPESVSHGRTGYYFLENGEHSLYELCKGIGEALVKRGRAEHAEPTVLSAEERVEYFGSEVVANLHFSNARCRADRARKELGWKPTHTTNDLFGSLEREVDEVLKTF